MSAVDRIGKTKSTVEDKHIVLSQGRLPQEKQNT